MLNWGFRTNVVFDLKKIITQKSLTFCPLIYSHLKKPAMENNSVTQSGNTLASRWSGRIPVSESEGCAAPYPFKTTQRALSLLSSCFDLMWRICSRSQITPRSTSQCISVCGRDWGHWHQQCDFNVPSVLYNEQQELTLACPSEIWRAG